MTEDEQLGQLYRSAISELPGGQPDALRARATARRRQRSRRTATAVVAAAAATTALLTVTPSLLQRGDLIATPPSAGQSSGAASPCPALLPGTSDALADYANLLIWDGRTYLQKSMLVDRPAKAELGPQVTTIGCSIAELTAHNGLLVSDEPWPDGTATALASGTPVFAVRGVDTRCELGVEDDHEVEVFVAVRDPDWEPVC